MRLFDRKTKTVSAQLHMQREGNVLMGRRTKQTVCRTHAFV